MKIINLKTNNMFDLPQNEAEKLLDESPDDFAKISKNKKIIRNKSNKTVPESVLSQILDE